MIPPTLPQTVTYAILPSAGHPGAREGTDYDTRHRKDLLIVRIDNYTAIMRTTIFTMAAIAAMIEFGPGGYSAPLITLTIAATAYLALIPEKVTNVIEAAQKWLSLLP